MLKSLFQKGRMMPTKNNLGLNQDCKQKQAPHRDVNAVIA